MTVVIGGTLLGTLQLSLDSENVELSCERVPYRLICKANCRRYSNSRTRLKHTPWTGASYILDFRDLWSKVKVTAGLSVWLRRYPRLCWGVEL